MANSYLPVSISLKNRTCLIIGGGKVALRKIDTLLDYDPAITVIAPEPDEKIRYYAAKGKLTLQERGYKSPEASDYGLVIAASDDIEVNKRVYDDCQRTGTPVNVVDNPNLCDFIFPAVVKRDFLTVAVSTDGKAPFLSGHLRLILDDVFPAHWKKIARHAAEFRKRLQERWADNPNEKAEAISRFLSADWKKMIKEHDDGEIRARLDRMLEGNAD
ncbi:MAG: bifunctional precorrin-2 dehydrogenase/sirohydrochlorin ferrochelatase [Candidatus Zixiibacteriota bacterium]|nr:MAG: bifunctional precorrin-2 dehydrogenase/sirohydrochlorin ferrochelatase [candidate division Zixibacteria bacterium]